MSETLTAAQGLLSLGKMEINNNNKECRKRPPTRPKRQKGGGERSFTINQQIQARCQGSCYVWHNAIILVVNKDARTYTVRFDDDDLIEHNVHHRHICPRC